MKTHSFDLKIHRAMSVGLCGGWLLFVANGLAFAQNRGDASSIPRADEAPLGRALSELGGAFGYKLELAAEDWAKEPVRASSGLQPHSLDEGLAELFSDFNYLLDRRGTNQIIIHILAKSPIKLKDSDGPVASNDPVEILNPASYESTTIEPEADWESRILPDGFFEWVEAPETELGQPWPDEVRVRMIGPGGVEEQVSTSGWENAQPSTKGVVIRSTTIDGIEEVVSVTPNPSIGREKGKHIVISDGPDGLEEVVILNR